MSSYFDGIITSTSSINTIKYVGNTISGILDASNNITVTPPYISETSTRYDFTINAMVIGGGGGGGGNSLPSGQIPSPNNIINAGSGGGGGANVLISFSNNLLTSNTFEAVIGAGGSGDLSGAGNDGHPTELNSGGSPIISAGGGIGGIKGEEGPPFPQGGAGGTVTNTAGVTIINGGSGGKGGQCSNKWQTIGLPAPPAYNGDSSQFGIDTAFSPILIPLLDIVDIFNAQYAGCGGGGGGSFGLSTPTEQSAGGLPGGQNVSPGGPYKPYSYTAGGLDAGVGRGVSASVYGGGGGGNSGSDITPNETGGNGKSGAIYFWLEFSIPPLRNGCEWNTELAAQTPVWNRFDGNCVDLNGATLHGQPMTRQDLDEKRKATIFQYKKNSAGFSKKQQYSRIARGLGQKKTTYATQSATYTNPNTNNLVLDASSVLICPGRAKNWAYSSQNDTPGPLTTITNEPNVPLTNYIVRRTYLAGNNKWPQLGPSSDPTSTSSDPTSSSLDLSTPMAQIIHPSIGNNTLITFINSQINYYELTEEQLTSLIHNLTTNIANVEAVDTSSGSLRVGVIIPKTNNDIDSINSIDITDTTILNIKNVLKTWSTNNSFSNSWTQLDMSSTTPIYNNKFTIYYIIANIDNISYIKVVLMNDNKVVQNDNTNLNEKIIPSIVPSQDSFVVIKNIANLENTLDTSNNFEILLHTYNKNNVLSSISQPITVTIFVPTVSINYPLNNAIIYNNTFNLIYNTTYLGSNNTVLLYEGTNKINDFLSTQHTFTSLLSRSYTFRLQLDHNSIAHDPPIYSSIDIEVKVPSVSITNTATIYNNTFQLSYDAINLGNSNTIQLFKDGTDIDYITGPYTFTNLGSGSYTFKLQIANSVLPPNPSINNSKIITMIVPSVSITNTVTTIYNNTFHLSYSATNLGSNNTIELYKDNSKIQVITSPYTFTNLSSKSYTFKLQIANSVLPPNPSIYNSKTIEMKVPTVSITNTDTTIYNNTFQLSYNATNLGSNNTIELYKDNSKIQVITSPYTFTNLSSKSYTFKLQIANSVLPPNPSINNSKIITMKVPSISITNTETTIYNNTFKLSYSTTNVENSNNTIELYKDNSKIQVITSPYTFTNLSSKSYTFKLQIANSVLPPNPSIYNSKTIVMKVPTVSITNTVTTIYNNTFELSYNITNLGDNIILINIDDGTKITERGGEQPSGPNATYTVTGLTDGTYTFKLRISNANNDLRPNPDIWSNSITITIAIPTISIISPYPATNNSRYAITTTTFDINYSVSNTPSDFWVKLLYNGVEQSSNVGSNSGSITVTTPTTNGDVKYSLKLVDSNGNSLSNDTNKNQASVYLTISVPKFIANNGTSSGPRSDGYTYYYFKNATGGNFKFTEFTIPMDILVVGGGGGGGWDGGYWGSGGGGAGAYVTGVITPSLNTQYNINIGAGGYGNGLSSSITTGTTTTVVKALGGGRGGDNWGPTVNGGLGNNTDPNDDNSYYTVPLSGPVGSGGGGSGKNSFATYPGKSYTYTYDVFTYSMNTGGSGSSNNGGNNPNRGGGGGGGAGGVGGSAPTGWAGGNGGAGKEWHNDEWYAGGGAGQGVNDRNNENYGGNGGGGGLRYSGGGGGSRGSWSWEGSGKANTGGGGAAGQGHNGYSGGSGICVIRLRSNSFIQE